MFITYFCYYYRDGDGEDGGEEKVLGAEDTGTKAVRFAGSNSAFSSTLPTLPSLRVVD